MKRNLVLAISLCILYAADAQYVNISDTGFRNYLKVRAPLCFNAAGQLDTMCAATHPDSSFTLTSSEFSWYNIGSINGVQYFKRIVSFYIVDGYGYISSIPKFPPRSKTIYLWNTLLGTLPAIPDSVVTFYADACNITALPPLPPTITYLSCYGNPLASLPPLPPGLITLYCPNDSLTALPLLPSSLTYIYCSSNKLTSLPALPASLIQLSCWNNKLPSLPALPLGLTILSCSRNNLDSLPALSPALRELDCGFNNITHLPAFPNSLHRLFLSHNKQLPSLPNMPAVLDTLSVDSTNIHCLPVLPTTLVQLTLTPGVTRCIPNTNSNLKINNAYSYPLCNVTNNVNGCNAFPVVLGHVFYDLNNNNTREPNEPFKPMTRIFTATGNYAVANDSGFYEIIAPALGGLTVAAAPHPFFNITPASKSFNFSSYDTSITQNFAYHATVFQDSVAVTITTLEGRARLGRLLTYEVRYQNAGSTTINAATVQILFDTAMLIYDSSNAALTQAGNVLTFNVSSLPMGGFGKFKAYFTVKTTLTVGDTVNTIASITGGAHFGSDTAMSAIRVSWDPNDKNATPILSRQQISNGKYIDYIIRYQNTGNDTAFHVVITDTLPSQLQSSTLEVIAASHLTNATVKGNAVSFEMRNIMLPDSNVNEVESHGYVRFRVKPVSTLTAGNAVNNKASIYFDYNSPVVTNTAVTQIVAQVLPLKLLTFTAKKDGKVNRLQWSTNNEVNVARFEIERSADRLEYSRIGAIRSGLSSYNFTDNAPITRHNYYRLKVIDKDGSFAYSSVRVVNNSGSFYVAVHPNPVKNVMHVEAVSNEKATLHVQVVSNNGKVLLTTTWDMNEGSVVKTINTSGLQSGYYFLRITSADKEQGVVKFEKM